MATTTTNFGWDIPQSTDLVKDGATAIAALGQDIDTALVDLKGGTTGQILAKASDTDLDYSWVTNDVGDITEVTAGTGLTGGGTSGAVTLSFDQANFGGGQYAAGKNKIINGDFGIWQRGTSFGTNVACADRFLTESDGTAPATQQTFTPGTAPVAGYEGTFFLRQARTASGSFQIITQRIEDVRAFAGETVTVSFWAKADATVTNEPTFRQQFGSGGSTVVQIDGATQTFTTSWARYSFTVNIPSISGKTIGTNSYLELRFIRIIDALAHTIDVWGVQVEAGSTASPFQTATGTIQGELAACQRYYYRVTAGANDQYLGSVVPFSSTGATGYAMLPVIMRATTSILEYSGLQLTKPGTGSAAVTSISVAYYPNSTNIIVVPTVASGLTGGEFRFFSLTTSGTSYFGISAEL
jgi:hypothetical protein